MLLGVESLGSADVPVSSPAPVKRGRVQDIGAFVLALLIIGGAEVVRGRIRHDSAKHLQNKAFAFAAAPVAAPLVVVLRSVDGSVRSCPASSFTFDPGVLEVDGVACPVDSVFHNGFES